MKRIEEARVLEERGTKRQRPENEGRSAYDKFQKEAEELFFESSNFVSDLKEHLLNLTTESISQGVAELPLMTENDELSEGGTTTVDVSGYMKLVNFVRESYEQKIETWQEFVQNEVVIIPIRWRKRFLRDLHDGTLPQIKISQVEAEKKVEDVVTNEINMETNDFPDLTKEAIPSHDDATQIEHELARLRQLMSAEKQKTMLLTKAHEEANNTFKQAQECHKRLKEALGGADDVYLGQLRDRVKTAFQGHSDLLHFEKKAQILITDLDELKKTFPQEEDTDLSFEKPPSKSFTNDQRAMDELKQRVSLKDATNLCELLKKRNVDKSTQNCFNSDK